MTIVKRQRLPQLLLYRDGMPYMRGQGLVEDIGHKLGEVGAKVYQGLKNNKFVKGLRNAGRTIQKYATRYLPRVSDAVHDLRVPSMVDIEEDARDIATDLNKNYTPKIAKFLANQFDDPREKDLFNLAGFVAEDLIDRNVKNRRKFDIKDIDDENKFASSSPDVVDYINRKPMGITKKEKAISRREKKRLRELDPVFDGMVEVEMDGEGTGLNIKKTKTRQQPPTLSVRSSTVPRIKAIKNDLKYERETEDDSEKPLLMKEALQERKGKPVKFDLSSLSLSGSGINSI